MESVGRIPAMGGGDAKSQMLLWHQYLEVLRKELGLLLLLLLLLA